ncbi:MAG: peptide MFS transporter, partial [Sphingomonas sp.]|nr:peptide MFS transporter [Sphingomonas sp.]
MGVEARCMTDRAAPSDWFGQPRGLTILFLTNMWEQFSYYGMRALLVYYMTRQLLISQEHSSLIYGAYTSFAYFTPIIGGTIADRYLGKKRAVIIGASMMAAGHFMMAFEPSFYFALATIALGNGLFLPSLPSQINDLYGPDDPRRGWAYNVYYVGVNVGGFLAPLICGTLGETFGWHWGFGAAGVGMLTGLVIYLLGQRHLPSSRSEATILPPQAIEQYGGSRRDTFLLLLAVGLAVTVFRGAYEQVGNTVAIWIEGVNRHVGSAVIPMTWFQSLNPLLVILLTPVLLARWKRKADAGREHSPLQKMAIGALIGAGAYALLALAATVSPTGASWWWVAGS